MKVLVSGATSRQANPDASKKDVTMAWLLSEALRDAGHEVEHRNPSISEDVSDFDHCFVGLAPLHGLGSNRAYGALSVILRTWASNKLTLFIDDADMGKIPGGLRTMKNNPERLTKPFFNYKLEWEQASQPEWKAWLQSGVEMLVQYQWPRLLVPTFPWADIAQIAKRVPQAEKTTVGIDLSAYLPSWPQQDLLVERTQEWITEAKPDERWMKQQHPTFPVHRFGKGADKRPHDEGLVQAYRQAWGVIDPPLDFGWWTSRMGYAVQVGALYITRWQNVSALGDAYGLLLAQAETLDQDLRGQWAAAQRVAFEAVSSTRDTVKQQLDSILNVQAAAA